MTDPDLVRPGARPGGIGWPASLRVWAGLLGLWTLLWPGPVAAQEAVTERSNKVEAAFLRNFARYVVWPSSAFTSDQAPWMVCILASDDFDDVLEQTLRGRTEQGRSFEIVRARTLDQLPPCNIVFVGHQNLASRRAALNELKKRPVLTVGHAPDFLQEGGVIRLRVGEQVEMSINLDQARAVALTIPSKMLEVSREVLENGSVRRWK